MATLQVRKLDGHPLGKVAASLLGAGPGSTESLLCGPATTRRLVRSEARLSLDEVLAVAVRVPDLALEGDDDLVGVLRHRMRMEANGAHVDAALSHLKESGPTAAREHLSDVLPSVAHLDEHQLIGCAALTVRGGWGACLFDEQGTGKTVTAMAAYDVLRQRVDADALVVVAPKSMIGEWKAEFARFYGPRYRVAVIGGGGRERTSAIHSRADVYVLNYEGVIRHGPELATLLRDTSTVLAVDESFFVKNPDAGRTRAVLRLRLVCDRAWVLCGTPAPNHPGDLVAQFDLVDLGRSFRGLTLPADRRAAAVSIRQWLGGAGWTRSRKDEVLDLPARDFRDLRVPMSPLQGELYEATAADLIEELRRLTDSQFAERRTHFLQRRAALLQLASNPSGVVDDYAEVPNKLVVIENAVRELVTAGEKVVVWSFYRRNMRALLDVFEDLRPAVIDGSVSAVDRQRAVSSFQNEFATPLFIGNPAAAGAGITLHAARHAVYESLSNQAAHFLQSLDRIHRRGQTRPVSYQVVLSEGTLEVPEYERLLEKASSQAELLGDAVFPGLERTTLLADLTRQPRA